MSPRRSCVWWMIGGVGLAVMAWALLLNSRRGSDGKNPLDELGPRVKAQLESVKQWPAGDQFATPGAEEAGTQGKSMQKR